MTIYLMGIHAGNDESNAERTTAVSVSIADLGEAWVVDATGERHPEWVRLRGFVDWLRLRPEMVAEAIKNEPAKSRWEVMGQLLAAMAEKLADDAKIARPDWTQKYQGLDNPWMAPRGRLKNELFSIPDAFRRRNVIIPETSIWREQRPG
jgi:hypothetical protein